MSRKTPYLHRRGDTFAFRIAVPADLRPHVGGREITKTLNTSVRARAVPMALEYAAYVKRVFSDVRAGMAAPDLEKLKLVTQQAKLKVKLSDHEEERQRREWEHHEEVKRIQADAEQRLRLATLEAENEAMRRVLASFPAVPIPIPVLPATSSPAAPRTAPVPTFHQVVNHFLDNYPKDKHPAMFVKHETVLPMLRDIVGDVPVTDLRQSHINGFFELLHCLPPRWKDECRQRKITVQKLAELKHEKLLGPKTFKDTYLASVKPFLEAAVTNWQDSGFPTTLTTKAIVYKGERKVGEDKQRPFKVAELKRLFEGAEMKAFAADPKQEHCLWLPLVGLFTGARINEVCQLNPQADILQDEESGIWYFWITEETEGDERIEKSTKNEESRRKVPVHSKLIELGFLEYVRKVKKTGAKLLFPMWKPSKGRASGEAEKWFRKLIAATGLRDDTKGARIVGFHAFRHTLENKGGNTKGLPWKIENITGHAIPGQSKVSRGYSGELDLKNKKDILEAIVFEDDFCCLMP